jgi:hypothetical protein
MKRKRGEAGARGVGADEGAYRRAARALLGVACWGAMALSLSGCAHGEFNEFVGKVVAGLLAALVIGLVALMIIGGIAAVCFLISLVLMVLNFSSPSRLSVAGAGAFGVMFVGSGTIGGGLLIAQAASGPSVSGDTVAVGAVWFLAHAAYAALLITSAVLAHLKLAKARAAPAGTVSR